MLKTLGFGKKRAPSEALIQKHREQLRIHTQWRDDLAKIRAISSKLDQAYAQHKGDFALGRYEGLKQMIKDAINDYKDLMQKTQKYALDGAAGAIASKYGGGQGQSRQSDKGQVQAEAQKEGFIARLKRQAAAFTGTSSGSNEVKETPKETNTASDDLGNWGYEGMTAKQVEEEIDSMRKEVLQFKQEFRRERDKLDRLSKEYEESKKLTPPQRYTELKYMIKDVVNTK